MLQPLSRCIEISYIYSLDCRGESVDNARTDGDVNMENRGASGRPPEDE